jgi:hypothetical protein
MDKWEPLFKVLRGLQLFVLYTSPWFVLFTSSQTARLIAIGGWMMVVTNMLTIKRRRK